MTLVLSHTSPAPNSHPYTPACAATAAIHARLTQQAQAAIARQLGHLDPPIPGPNYLRPLVRGAYAILLASTGFLARTAHDRLAPDPDLTPFVPPTPPASRPAAEAQAQAYASALTFVLAEAAVRLSLPAFIPALPLLRTALQRRATQHLTHDPDATAALIATHTPALLQSLRAGTAEAAEREVGVLRAFMYVEHPAFILNLPLPETIAPPAARHLVRT